MKKALSLILVLVMAAALLICPAAAAGGNGGGGGGGTGGGGGQSPLNVVSVTIGDKDLSGAVILPEGTITVVFDRGMDKNSETTAAAIRIKDAECTVEFDGDRTFSVSFSDLARGEYTLVIGADAKANNGNTLGKDYEVNFTVDFSGSDYGETCACIAFTDVDRGEESWYHDAVDWAVTENITKGTSETTFSPEKACTRAEAVTFLYRAAGSPSVDGLKNPFSDVQKGSFYYDAVLWAVSKGVTNGVTKTTFEPNTTCTRAHIVTFQYRAAGSPVIGYVQNDFTDVPAGAWYTDAVLWAGLQSITNGVSKTSFAPMIVCTRAMIVTFLYRASIPVNIEA